jgi:hypothetical protein
MQTIVLAIGSSRHTKSGRLDETLHTVKFTGEKLGQHTHYPGQSDDRGLTTTLYRTEDERLIVYAEDWTNWQGETSTYSLYEVQEEDLQPGGRFADVGAVSGYGRPLTLDEALTLGQDEAV